MGLQNHCLWLFLLGSVFTAAAAEKPAETDATEILRAADRARGAHTEGIEWTVAVTAAEDGRTHAVVLQVLARGYDVLGITREPPNRAGNRVLLRGGNMWYHQPDLSKPVPVSQRQKLLGQAAYADIATTDYAGQYRAQRLPDEIFEGQECYVFDLHAAGRQATYDRIRYRVEKSRRVGLSAEYYTVSGRLLKTARLWYEHATVLPDGTVQPFCSRMVIADAVTTANRTVLDISPPRLRPVSPAAFNVNLFGRSEP